ncbi:hypothetical protein Tco_0388583 [Tanacetum coccineum]
MENANPPPANNRPVLLATLCARFNQELQKILAFTDSLLESIKRFLNRFTDQPNETSTNYPESDDRLGDTPLVSPFPHSDNDSDDEEVLNELSFRKFTAYLDPFLPMNIISRKAYNTIMVDRLEGTGKNILAIVRDVYVFTVETASRLTRDAVTTTPVTGSPQPRRCQTPRLYLMRRSLEVLRKFHWMILGGRFNQLSHVSSPLLSKPGEY